MELELRLEVVSEPRVEKRLPGWMLYEIGNGHWWKRHEKPAKKLVIMWVAGELCWSWIGGPEVVS
jgi:hypothetical protein